jgi:hypothetical protein
MAYNARRTEHSGPKQGRGAFYGPKAEAKKASNRRRRQDDRQAVLNELENSPQLPTECRDIAQLPRYDHKTVTVELIGQKKGNVLLIEGKEFVL